MQTILPKLSCKLSKKQIARAFT